MVLLLMNGQKSCQRFYRKIDAALDICDSDLSIKTKKSVIDRSLGMMSNKIDTLMDDRVREQKLRSRAKRKIETMRNNDGGGGELLIDDKFCPDLIFDDEVLKLRKKHFGESSDSDGINDSSLQK